jgi:hypothetical protein
VPLRRPLPKNKRDGPARGLGRGVRGRTAERRGKEGEGADGGVAGREAGEQARMGKWESGLCLHGKWVDAGLLL